MALALRLCLGRVRGGVGSEVVLCPRRIPNLRVTPVPLPSDFPSHGAFDQLHLTWPQLQPDRPRRLSVGAPEAWRGGGQEERGAVGHLGVLEPYLNLLMFFSDTRMKSTMG